MKKKKRLNKNYCEKALAINFFFFFFHDTVAEDEPLRRQTSRDQYPFSLIELKDSKINLARHRRLK